MQRPRTHFRLLVAACAVTLFALAMRATTAAATESSVEVMAGVTGLTAAVVTPTDAVSRATIEGWVDQLRTGWTPNLGQIGDASGRPCPNVLFATTVGATRVLVTTTGLSHYFFAREDEGDGADEEAERIAGRDGRSHEPLEREARWNRLDVTLAGASIRGDHVRLEEPLAEQGSTSYYLAHCPAGVRDLPSYGRITFSDVYPGIDWVVRSVPGDGVHQDFVVHPGADAARIRLEYAGASAIDVSDDQRTLRIRTPLGEVKEGALRCTQADGATSVGARFRVDGHAVSVVLDAYDHAKPLVIDPPLVWSTYYGGGSFDGPRAIVCDNVNDVVYVVGYTNSTNLPVMNPGGGTYFEGVAPAGQDAFIWKFSQAGVRLWATYYGGTGVEFLADGAVDAAGNFYAAGYTVSTDLPTYNLAGAYFQGANGGNADAFLLKFDASGARQWATYYGGKGADQVDALTTDASGRLYACGMTTSSTPPLVNPGGAYFQPAPNSVVEALLLRFSAADSLEWATFFGGTSYDDATGIAVSGNKLYVTGFTQSPASFPVLNPGGGAYFQGTFQGNVDAFLSRFTLAGALTWSTFYGAAGQEYGDQVAVDANGNVFIMGDTDSPAFPTLNPGGSAYYQASPAGSSDLYIVKFDSSNVRLWGTCYGGTNLENTGGSDRPLALDAQGNVYVTGQTASSDLPVLNPGGGSFYQATPGGQRDSFLGQFKNSGSMLWSTYLASNGGDFGTGVAIGNGGCLFATGESSGTNNFVTVNPGPGTWYQPANAGGDDGYITRFCTPPSSCCLDFTCVPVFSQSQCTAMGGTAFYPNQPCSTISCTILCKICGTKYLDSNRNGVQDVGEAALPGWTIQLLYPNGTLFASATTDGSGNYCFNDIPCGPWKVNEAMQPAWVQTAPSPAVHTLNLPTGATQNGVNFGNYSCGTPLNCLLAPPRLAAWWAFDFDPGATSTVDVAHLNPARNVAQLQLDATSAQSPGALCLMSAFDHARVPNADQLGLQFGAGSFSIAAWLNVGASTAGPRTIVEKRVPLAGSSTGQSLGWALYLTGNQSHLEIGTGGAPQVVTGPDVPADTWTHLAVSIDRVAHEGRWYLDGSPIAAFDFAPIAGNVSSGGDLYMGSVSPAFGTGAAFQGCIGDLELFAAPMSPAAAAKAATTGPITWCPEYAVMPQVTSICQSQTTAQVCFNICNNTGVPRIYHWSLAGLPAGPGCTLAGPTLFVPASGAVTVPAGGCSPPICVTITRPAGLTAQNATACFALTFINDATGACRSKTGTLRADNTCWCLTPIPAGVVSVPAGAGGATIGIGVHAPCDPPALLAYRISAVWLDPDHEDPLALSLDGLQPGTPVTGLLNSARGGEQMIHVTATLPNGYDFATNYEVVVEADVDGNGLDERLCGTVVTAATYDSTERVGVNADAPMDQAVRLLTNPNPFISGTTIGLVMPRAEATTLGVYDLSGRLVRTLQRGPLTAGSHRFEWNGRDDSGRRTPAGVYFVSFDGPSHHVKAKLTKLR